MTKIAIPLLRVDIVVLLLGSVLAQVLLPVFGILEATIFPELAYLVGPYAVAGILVIACVQVALLVVWQLLSLVGRGAFFTRRALRRIDVITACAVTATVLSAGVMTHLIFFVGAYHALLSLGLVACLAGGLGVVFGTVVIHGVLESAIVDRSQLDEIDRGEPSRS